VRGDGLSTTIKRSITSPLPPQDEVNPEPKYLGSDSDYYTNGRKISVEGVDAGRFLFL